MTTDVLLLCDDLLFASKVTGTAQAHALQAVVVRTPAELRCQRAQLQPRCIIVDLQHRGLDIAALLRDPPEAPPTRFIAFGSHVDAAALHAARAAGCDLALPRSAFVERLEAELLDWCAPVNSTS